VTKEDIGAMFAKIAQEIDHSRGGASEPLLIPGKTVSLPSTGKDGDWRHGAKSASLATIWAAGIGLSGGFSATTAYVLYGWVGLSLVLMAFASGILFREGVRWKW